MGRLIRQLSRILFAWYRLILNPDPLASARLAVCTDCDYRKGLKCGLCGCPLRALSQLEDGCEAGKWTRNVIKSGAVKL